MQVNPRSTPIRSVRKVVVTATIRQCVGRWMDINGRIDTYVPGSVMLMYPYSVYASTHSNSYMSSPPCRCYGWHQNQCHCQYNNESLHLFSPSLIHLWIFTSVHPMYPLSASTFRCQDAFSLTSIQFWNTCQSPSGLF